jgi:hypothetical protein
VLKAQILAGVNSARSALSDLLVQVPMTRRGVATHVPGQIPVYPTTEVTISIAVVGYTAKEIDGQRILINDMKGIIFPTSDFMEPKPNDLIQFDDLKYRVIHNEKIMAGDTVALSVVQLRVLEGS